MNENKLLSILQEHYVLIALAPVASGACFISGFLFPLGSNALGVINYVDLINFAILFAVLAAYVAGVVLGLSIVKRNLERIHGISRIESTIGNIFFVLIGILVIVVASSLIIPSQWLSFITFCLLMGAVAPISYIYLLQEKPMSVTALTVIFVFVGAFIMGSWFGNARKNYMYINDQVCTDKCYRVGIFAMLSEFVIALDCNGRAFFFPKSEIKKVIIGKRPSGINSARWSVKVSDGSQCVDDPLVKN